MAADTERRERGRDVDRLTTFADAVIAIAVTLLALPLVDLPREYEASLGAAKAGQLADLLGQMAFPALGFVISFFVIARLWWAHHRITAGLVELRPPIVALTVFWLFSVVLIAISTAVTTSLPTSPAGVSLYIGVMLVSNLLLTALAVFVHRVPGVSDAEPGTTLRAAVASAEATIGFVLALVIRVLFPAVNFFALFVLALTGRLGEVVARRIESRRR